MAEGNSAFPLFSPQWTDKNMLITNEQPDQEEIDRVNMQLYDMFVDCIDPCVIQEVAVSRNWNINEAINDLVTLTSSDCRKLDSAEKCLPESLKQNMVQSPPRGNNGIRKNGKRKTNLETVYNKPGSLLTGFLDLINLNTQPKLSEVKISYSQELGEDDDADVIIVKGNEFLQGIEEKTVSQQSPPPSATSSTSTRPQFFKQLMPEFLSSNKNVETKTDKKTVVQKEKQKKNNSAMTDMTVHNAYGHIMKKKLDPFRRVILLINNDIKVMVFMRGCPGSGKTYLSKLLLQKAQIKAEFYSKFLFSADNYFNNRGVYVFNPDHLGDAHTWARKCVITAAEESRNPIIIDNTNTQMWEMKVYASIGVKYGYHLEILEPNTPWAFKERELAKKNVHNVPKSKIRNMLERYERNITPAMLLSQLNLRYPPGNELPQLSVKKQIKQVKSGQKKKTIKKIEKSKGTEKLLKNDSVLFVSRPLTEASKSDRKPLDNSSILELDEFPELRSLIENIRKQRGEMTETSSNDKINNNENVISEFASNYTSMDNSFEEQFCMSNEEEEISSSDNQSSSENESLLMDDNLQNNTTVANEIATLSDKNYNCNLINGSSDLILLADGNNIPKYERKEDVLNILDSQNALEDNLHSNFARGPASADLDNFLLDICDLPTCNKSGVLSKHVHSVEKTTYNSGSFTEANRRVSDIKLIFESNVPSNDETESTSRSCTSYSFTAETLAKHIHEVQDSNYCKAIVEYKSSTVDLINLWNEPYQERENTSENENYTLDIRATSAGNSQSLHGSVNENMLLEFVLVNDSSHTNQLCIVEEENNTSIVPNVVTSELETNTSYFSSLLLPQSEDSENLSLNQQNQKKVAVTGIQSDLFQREIVDKVANFTCVLTSEQLKQQNRNVELGENISTKNSDFPGNKLIDRGIQFFENISVQIFDFNSFDADSNKIVNSDENQNESIEGTVNINDNLHGKKSECYNDIKYNVDDEALNTAVQNINCKTFNTADEKNCGNLDKIHSESQTEKKEIDNANSDCISFDFKESGNAIELEDNQNTSEENVDETREGNILFLSACPIEDDSPDTTDCINGISCDSNSIHKGSIKNNESDENFLNDNDRNLSSRGKVSLIQYLLDKQVENSYHSNDKNLVDILNMCQPELSPNLSSSSDKDCQNIPFADFQDFIAPGPDGNLIQNFDLLAYLSDKRLKEDAVCIKADKNVQKYCQDHKERLHTVEENEYVRKNEGTIVDGVLEGWEKQGGIWDESDRKETEKDADTEIDTVIPKPPRNNIKTRIRNVCGSPINLIENISDSCDWDTIDNPTFNWNSPDTVHKTENNTEVKPQQQRDSKPKPTVADQSTNTCYTDFNLFHDCSDKTIKETILFSKNRNICEGRSANTNVYKPNILMFDRSTMTGDDLAFETKLKYDFQQLVEMFPETELGSLMELVDRCGGNLDWAADVLADSERNTLLTVDNSFHNTSDVPHGMCDAFKESFVQANVPSAEELFLDLPSQSVRLKKSAKQEKNSVSESQLELKKMIESTFVLDKSHYSEHVWKIKKKKNGDYAKRDNGTDKEDDGYYPFLQESEDSEFLNIKSDTEDESSEEEEKDEDKIDNLEDTEDDDVEEGSSLIEVEEQTSDAEVDDEEGTVKLTLDWNLIMQLQKTFGNPLPDMKDLKPDIELPLSLARQVHSYIVESLIHQIEQQQDILDQMIAEDNAFAWQLQQQEDEKASTSAQQPVPQLQEIMDMEMALALYRADQEDWKQQSRDSMADRLSKKLLLEKFPQIDCNVLMEMFHAHNCSLHDTVATLSMSLSVDEPGLVQREMELLANAKEEKVKIQNSKEATVFSYAPTDRNNQRLMLLKKESGDMRLQASHYYELRKECFTKAQNMCRSGNKAVASYYSHLAELYKEKMELCNSQAAACLLYARTNSQTLDLHFLHVAEAEEVLKLFLDESIAQLKEKQKSRAVLYLITGRGLHSADGISRIKGMVSCRLRKRKIKYSEVNPGMLKAIVTKNTQLSHK